MSQLIVLNFFCLFQVINYITQNYLINALYRKIKILREILIHVYIWSKET